MDLRTRYWRARGVLRAQGWQAFLLRYRWQAASVLLCAVLAGLVIALVAQGSSRSQTASSAPALQRLGVAAAAVPTNHVTGSGSATLQLRGEVLTITIRSHGLLNGSPHLMHIHGEGRGTCPPASAARLHNGHLAISTGDGIRYYGPALTSLTEWGSIDGGVPNNVDFSRYPANGSINYTRTMVLPRLVADLIRDGDAVLVVHGIDYNSNHVYDFGALGVSDLDRTFPAEATAPALCGAIRLAPGTQSAADRPSSAPSPIYVASLEPESIRLSDAEPGPKRFLLFCELSRWHG